MRLLKAPGKRGLIAALVVTILVAPLLPSQASELDEAREQQRNISRQIEERQQQIAATEEDIDSVSAKLTSLQQQITTSEQELAAIKTKLDSTEEEMARVREQLAATEARLAQQRTVLQGRVRELYMNGNVNYLEVLLQATTVQDFLVRLQLIQKMAEADAKLVENIESERQQVVTQKEELQAKQQQLARLQEQQEAKKANLRQTKAQEEQLLDKLQNERDTARQALDELEALSRQIDAEIREIQARQQRAPSQRGTSGFYWPVPGYSTITSPFGWRVHPILGTNRFHPAVDIGGANIQGAKVMAIEDGTVLYAGWRGGYGNAIILDHGGGISSQYSHLSEIKVQYGQEVRRGQEIGRVGSTGLSTGPHLDFIIRVNGEPVNPLQYY